MKLVDFKKSLEDTVKETHQLQREQTEAIGSTIQSLQAGVDEQRRCEDQ